MNTKLAYWFVLLLLQRLELLQCLLGRILMGEVLHVEIPEDNPVLHYFAGLLYVPSGGDIFEQGVNFQSLAPVRPFVVT